MTLVTTHVIRGLVSIALRSTLGRADLRVDDLAFLLDNGIKVSLVHGDLDFACPVSVAGPNE